MSISGNYSNPYGNYGYSSSSSLGGSSATSSADDIKFSNPQPAAGSAGGEQKSGGIKGFFKGIFNGAKNAVKSLFTPKGLLMAAAGLAACIAFPVAAPLILGGIAVTAGGYQMFKGAQSGDSEKMGEGFFTAGTGALGVWGSGAVGAAKAGSAGGAGSAASGTETAAATSSKPGIFSGLWAKITGKTPAATETAAAQPKPAPAASSDTPGLPTAPPSGQPQNSNGNNFSTTRAGDPISSTGPATVRLPGSNNTPATPAATTATEGTAATATNATEGAAATAGNAATKTGPFAGTRATISNSYNFVKNPFVGPMPEGAIPPAAGVFGRTGQLLTGKAYAADGTAILPTKPIWSLPTTTGLSGGLPQPGQEQAAG